MSEVVVGPWERRLVEERRKDVIQAQINKLEQQQADRLVKIYERRDTEEEILQRRQDEIENLRRQL